MRRAAIITRNISLLSNPEIRIRTHAAKPKMMLDVFHPRFNTSGVIREPAIRPMILFPRAENVASIVESSLSCVMSGRRAVLEIP